LKIYLPDLFYHLKNQQINDIFLSKWILTLFSSYLPFDTLAKIWDVFLLDGWKSMIKFSLILLYELKDIIIKMDLNSLSKYFRDYYRTLHNDPKKILNLYEKFKVTNKELSELREQYFLDLAKKKLEDSNSIWENDQQEPLKFYKNEKLRLEKVVKKEIMFYREKVQNITKIYQNSKKDYFDFVKACNGIKNKIEEFIDSKAAYDSVLEMLKNERQTMQIINSKKSETLRNTQNNKNNIKDKQNISNSNIDRC